MCKCFFSSLSLLVFGWFSTNILRKRSSSHFGGTPSKNGEVAIGAPPVVATPSMANIPIAMSQRHICFEEKTHPSTALLIRGHLSTACKKRHLFGLGKGKLMKRFVFFLKLSFF